jgi:hypothetical protein
MGKMTAPNTEPYSDDITGEVYHLPTDTPLYKITITPDPNGVLYFDEDSLSALAELADGKGVEELRGLLTAKRSGAGRSSGPTANTYAGTNQIVSVVRKWARENGGTTKDGKPVAESARFTLSDETFAKMLAANPTWAAGFGESEGAGARIADKVIGASVDVKPSGVTVAGTAVKK